MIAASETAIVALEPVRSRLLRELCEPRSSSELARLLGLPRQRVHHHVGRLEARGLVASARERHWGGITERLLVATTRAYLVSPEALGAAADPDSDVRPDRMSASYLAAVAGRTVREVGALLRRSRASGRRAETFVLDAEITFPTPQARTDFMRDITEVLTAAISRYHDQRAPNGRCHRLVLGAYPIRDDPAADAEATSKEQTHG